jgi:hypothetical protein
MDPVPTGLVARRRHHPTIAGTTDDHRQAAQLGSTLDLTRDEERVHVDVEDPAPK